MEKINEIDLDYIKYLERIENDLKEQELIMESSWFKEWTINYYK
ncbi:TPA: hypothetical protein ACOTHO_002708 [Clostridium perfringens]